MYTGENVRPDFAAADFAISFDHLRDPRHFRSPWWAQWVDCERLVRAADAPPPSAGRKFCSIVVSNGDAAARMRFCERLSRYKHVDSGGRYMNNVGGPVRDKLAFIGGYKFNICFENSAHPGYTTEKLPEPPLARTLPIYWGDPEVDREFDPAGFIWIRDLRRIDDAIERIVEADRSDAEYARYFQSTPLVGNRLPAHCDADFCDLTDFLERVAKSTVTPVAERRAARAVAHARHAVRHLTRRGGPLRRLAHRMTRR